MSTFKKHVGRIKNTDRRCVVVYMQIPGNEENALIVDTDALPDRFHDALMDIIDSVEGQQAVHLHSLLSRRILPDLGLDMMNALHTYGLLRPVGIDNIVMYPAPNAPCPLRTIVDYMNGEDAPKVEEETKLENRILENQKADSAQAQLDIANNMLRQAEDLENSAAAKREQAYRLAPELRPQVTASPEVTEASETATETPVEAPQGPAEAQTPDLATTVADTEGMAPVTPVDEPSYHIADEVDVSNLPDDVKMALHAAVADLQRVEVLQATDQESEEEGNQVDTSDDAIQAFLDRAAHREDQANKELQESLKPKNPVGRPRKDGAPAGSVKESPVDAPVAVKKRGRPPKAKK